MSVLESQTYGTPVIGADIGGIPELVEDRRDGLLFQPGNVNELVERIQTLYNDRDLLNQYSERCLEKVKTFSIERYYNELMIIYNIAIQKHNKSKVKVGSR
jgi:glycosyltransferase involved in cell wall biosynthesis